jgi:hypothetical protein
MSSPFTPLAAQLTFGEIDVGPFESDHFAAAQPCVSTEQHDQVGNGSKSLRCFLEPRVSRVRYVGSCGRHLSSHSPKVMRCLWLLEK